MQRVDSSVQSGVVSTTNPPFGTRVDHGSTVTVVVSSGPRANDNAVFQAFPSLRHPYPLGGDARIAAIMAARLFVLCGTGSARFLDGAGIANDVHPEVPADGVSVVRSSWAKHDRLVRHACGPEVAARSWSVTLDDGTNSASLDQALYLIRRPDRWKVWGSY
jgi:hypothetical protein